MDQQLDIVVRLTERTLAADQRRRSLYDFARTTGWRPSDALVDCPGTEQVANGHLVAEYGLERSAVISFLADGSTFEDLSHTHRGAILAISYNNLIDWHLFPDRHGLTVVFNREVPLQPDFIRRSQRKDLWRVEAFDAITGRRPSSNVKALDDALIETVSLWRRALAAEIGTDVPNQAYAALFNGIILVRAAEDQKRHRGDAVDQTILSIVEQGDGITCRDSIEAAMGELRLDRRMKLIREILTELDVFDAVERRTWAELIGDFYSNRFAPYRYDFSLISKHALSRVYEKYVSVLRADDTPQLTLFAALPSEERQRSYGEVYTPQYIARFFARFLKEEMTPPDFRSARVVDPACGSGIFLRSLLEMQCDPNEVIDLQETVATAFSNVAGVDVDPNACFAARLSLSLLHLVLTDAIPSQVRIVNEEALQYFPRHASELESYDAVIENPPFVKWDDMKPIMRDRIIALLGDEYRGKIDLSTAFLALALDLIRPGGYLMFVLPHSFLLANSSRNVRRKLAETCTIRVLADLSEVPVFEGIGSYVILLICQKRAAGIQEAAFPPTVYARVRDYVGHALQAVLQRREVAGPAFDVYEIPPGSFTDDPWIVLPQRQQQLLERLRTLPTLNEICHVQQGIVTGADTVLIRDARDIDRSERSIWRSLLRDREITRYRLRKTSPEVVFYPFDQGKRLDEETLRERYSDSWAYLLEHRTQLEQRPPVRSGKCAWWELERPRKPEDVFGRPKLVSPHLCITPRFGFDVDGRFAVTRSPMILARERSDELALLKYVAAVLNSAIGFWQVIVTSHKYRSGYAMLEKKTLDKINLPDPATLDRRLLREILSLMEQRLKRIDEELDQRLDRLVSKAFGLTEEEQAEIGLNTP